MDQAQFVKKVKRSRLKRKSTRKLHQKDRRRAKIAAKVKQRRHRRQSSRR